MNVKNISIALTVLVIALLATLLMQKGSYVSQATEHYTKTTTNSYKGASKIIEYVNNSIDVNKGVWSLAVEAVQTVKTSQDQARLESKYFPSTKGSMSIANMTRRFEATGAYYIVSKFSKVEVDKKTDVKSLAGLGKSLFGTGIAYMCLTSQFTKPQIENKSGPAMITVVFLCCAIIGRTMGSNGKT